MTKFPPRPIRYDNDILEIETGICDCGHPDYRHHTVESKLWDVNNKWNNYTECSSCMCPHFSLQHKMTYGEYIKARSPRRT